MKEKDIRIFIVTYEADFLWLSYLLRSIERYCYDFSGITIVCDNDKSKIPQTTLESIQNLPLEVIYVEPPTTKPESMTWRKGYMWQQVVKLNWWQYCDEKYCMQIDSDCIFKQKFGPKNLQNNKGQWYYHYRPWQAIKNSLWQEPTDKLLRIKTTHQSMLGRTFVFERQLTKALIKHITKPYNTDVFDWNFIMNQNIDKFSEYCLYGPFIQFINPTDEYEIKIWQKTKDFILSGNRDLNTKYWSYAGMTEEIVKEYESYLQ